MATAFEAEADFGVVDFATDFEVAAFGADFEAGFTAAFKVAGLLAPGLAEVLVADLAPIFGLAGEYDATGFLVYYLDGITAFLGVADFELFLTGVTGFLAGEEDF